MVQHLTHPAHQIYALLDTQANLLFLECPCHSAIGNLELKAEDGITYTLEYADPNHVHAVSKVNGVAQAYDANGNPSTPLRPGMILRVVDGVTYSQTWDAENRLVQVSGNGHTTSFTYDGDGALVKKVADGQSTIYAGNQYEKILSPELETKYYYFNGSRVAMRKAGVLQYLAGDHPSARSGQASAPPASS